MHGAVAVHAGWYGTDCSLAAAGVDLKAAPPSRLAMQPWLRDVVVEPAAAQDPPPAPTRLRPLVYIYDLEPLYNSKLLQYRCGTADAALVALPAGRAALLAGPPAQERRTSA